MEAVFKHREKDDKSKYFIEVLGYSPSDPERLASDFINGLDGANLVSTEPGYGGSVKEVWSMELGVSQRRLTDTVWEVHPDGSRRLITAYRHKE